MMVKGRQLASRGHFLSLSRDPRGSWLHTHSVWSAHRSCCLGSGPPFPKLSLRPRPGAGACLEGGLGDLDSGPSGTGLSAGGHCCP